jgi:hypothetical protein
MHVRRFLMVLVCGLLAARSGLAAEIDPGLTRVIRSIPRTDADLSALHSRSKEMACEPIAGGQSLEVPGFNEPVSHRGAVESGPKALFESSRRSVLSFGMDMTPEDQQQLPFLSGGKILEFVDQTYIALQVRIERETPGGEPFLYFRPVAVQGEFGNRRGSMEFHSMMRESVSQVCGLGLYVQPGRETKPENLRTLVALHRSLADDARQAELERAGAKERRPHFELLCVRARVVGQSTERQVALHTFVTTEDRTRLHYLPTYKMPAHADDCTIKSTIYFTGYGFANLYPAAKSTRRMKISDRSNFAMSELDRYAAGQGWDGDALANLTEVLDAIIDGRIR